MRVRRLILLRHGQTEHNAENRMQGQIDTHLSEHGLAQARIAAVVMAERRPLAIVSSDLTRAHDTALALSEATGLPVHTDARLRETNLGQWQGLTHHDVDEQFPGARATWRADATWAPPGGESRVDVAQRTAPVVRELVDELGDAWDERPVIVVAHGGAIAALTASLLDLPVTRWTALGGLGNASWATLSVHGESADHPWRLDVWNASAQVSADVL